MNQANPAKAVLEVQNLHVHYAHELGSLHAVRCLFWACIHKVLEHQAPFFYTVSA